MRVAVVQLSSQDVVGDNLAEVRAQVAAAAAQGAGLVALPENFAFMGEEADKRALAEPVAVGEAGSSEGPIVGTLRELARAHGVTLVAGGMPERSDDPERPFNTSVLVDPSGRVAARYRKIHLFDVDLADGTRLLESGATAAGSEPVVADVPGVRAPDGGPVRVGLSICYDVRFPELYRRLVDDGARILTVPAAFTVTTGKDHWHVLLRARAIESQAFVLAPAQHGRHPRGRSTYGKSLVVDPWGDVLAQAREGVGVAVVDLDLAAQDRVRATLPSLRHRRLGGGAP